MPKSTREDFPLLGCAVHNTEKTTKGLGSCSKHRKSKNVFMTSVRCLISGSRWEKKVLKDNMRKNSAIVACCLSMSNCWRLSQMVEKLLFEDSTLWTCHLSSIKEGTGIGQELLFCFCTVEGLLFFPLLPRNKEMVIF